MSTEEKTTALAATGSALEQLEQMGGGLAGFDGSEAGTPRIKINGPDAVWTDDLSGLEVPEFTAVICGITKQRILWPAEVQEEKSDPLCKSLDAEVGRPNAATFPIKESKFELTVIDEGAELDCSACFLKDWDSHPTRPGPWCTEQIVMILLADFEGSGDYLPSLLSVQRSGLKPVRRYLGDFKRRGVLPFSTETVFTLNPQKRGNVNYAVPVLKKGEPTDQDVWEAYASTYLSVSAFISTWRDDATADDDSEITVDIDAEMPDF